MNGLVGCVVFPIVPMTFEEILSRLNPDHLLTVTVFLQAGNQLISMAMIFLAGGFLFNKPTKEKASYFQIGICCVYSLLFLLNIVIRFFASVDAQRPSVKQRIRTKENLVKGIKEEESEDGEINDLVTLDDNLNTKDIKISKENLLTNESIYSDKKKQGIAKIGKSDNYESVPTLSNKSSNTWGKEKGGSSQEVRTIEPITEENNEGNRHKESEEIPN